VRFPSCLQALRPASWRLCARNAGGYCAECLTNDIFTQTDCRDALRAGMVDAVNGFYFDRISQSKIRLHFVREALLASNGNEPGGNLPSHR